MYFQDIVVIVFVLSFVFFVLFFFCCWSGIYLFVYLLMFTSQISNCSFGFFFFSFSFYVLPSPFNSIFVLLVLWITYSTFFPLVLFLSPFICVCIVNALVCVSMNLCTHLHTHKTASKKTNGYEVEEHEKKQYVDCVKCNEIWGLEIRWIFDCCCQTLW